MIAASTSSTTVGKPFLLENFSALVKDDISFLPGFIYTQYLH